MPPERGIPEFRDIIISDVIVHGAQRAFFAEAYSEKPIRNVILKNIKIDAKQPGEIHYADGWKMKNVLLQTPDGKNIQLKGCSDVELPRVVTVN